MAQPAWMPYFTFGIALLGAVLGVINVWRSISRDRVNLRVMAVWGRTDVDAFQGEYVHAYSEFGNAVDSSPYGILGVRVINTGLVDVSISSLGFTHCGWVDRHRPSRFRRIPIKGGGINGDVSFPITLKPRTGVTLYGERLAGDFAACLSNTTRVYVATDCGTVVFSSGRLLREVVRRARHLA